MSLQNFHSLYEWRKDGKEASALHSIFTQSSITYKTDVWTSGKIVSENKFKRKNWAWTFAFAQDTVIDWANRITIGSQKVNEKNRFRCYKKNTKILIDNWWRLKTHQGYVDVLPFKKKRKKELLIHTHAHLQHSVLFCLFYPWLIMVSVVPCNIHNNSNQGRMHKEVLLLLLCSHYNICANFFKKVPAVSRQLHIFTMI